MDDYHEAACKWCVEMGARSLEEVAENADEFGSDVGLKPIERQRLKKWARQVSGAATTGQGERAVCDHSEGDTWDLEPRTRSERLVVDSQGHTGLDLRWDPGGILVRSVDPLPGQPGLSEGDCLVAIEGCPLQQKTRAEIDAIFAERLRNGALLTVVSRREPHNRYVPKGKGQPREQRSSVGRGVPRKGKGRGGYDANRMWTRFRGPPW